MEPMRPLLALALVACVDDLGTDVPGSRAGVVVEDCVVPVAGRGAPVALEYVETGSSLWLWDDARALVTSAEAACAGDVTVLAGAPVPLLPDETAPRTDGRHIAVTPRGGFVAGGRGYLYYDKQLLGPGFFDVEPLGVGLCLVDAPDQPCARTPDLLWTGRAWGGPGLVGADGYAYLTSCAHVGAFTDACAVARVRPEQAADAAAYQRLGFDGTWSAGADSIVALGGTGDFTVEPALGRWLAIFPDIYGVRLRAAIGDGPGGAFDEPVTLFPAAPTTGFFIAGGRSHAALRRGDLLAISYASQPSGLHLVSFRLDPEDWP